MTILSKKLETMNYDGLFWHHIYNKNMDILNQRLLKLNGILEINTEDLLDGDLIRWDTTQNRWVRTDRKSL